MSVYSVVWKYKIKPENKEVFEFEYGIDGSWSLLFNTSKNYKGSILHISEDKADTYLLIDTWTNKSHYEKFIELNKKVYTELSSKFNYLYQTEDKIGTFNSLH